MSKDTLLQIIVKYSNASSENNIPITVSVDGFLISGEIVDFETYAASNAILSHLNDLINQALPDESGKSDSADASNDLPEYLHLSNAKYYSTAGNPIPGNSGISVRIRISSIHSFFLGLLEAQTEQP